jgi:hypothetical protein
MTHEHYAQVLACNAWMNLSGVGNFATYWENTKDYWLDKVKNL